MSLALFGVLSLASYRIWRLIGKDTISASFRARIAGSQGEGLTSRIRRWAFDALQCPWCSGTWISAAVVATADYFTSVPLPGLTALAVAAAVGLIDQLDRG